MPISFAGSGVRAALTFLGCSGGVCSLCQPQLLCPRTNSTCGCPQGPSSSGRGCLATQAGFFGFSLDFLGWLRCPRAAAGAGATAGVFISQNEVLPDPNRARSAAGRGETGRCSSQDQHSLRRHHLVTGTGIWRTHLEPGGVSSPSATAPCAESCLTLELLVTSSPCSEQLRGSLCCQGWQEQVSTS